ncbi:MAG: threonine--tRNA ligase [Chitinophagales bacterium]
MINIKFPDGNVREYEAGTSAMAIAKSISHGLAKKVISAEVNGEVWDALRPINADADLKLLTFDDEDGKKTFWHSSAHLMAEALEVLYPGVKLGIGPAIDNGFYYDIDLGEDKTLVEEDLTKIENTMRKLAKNGSKFVRKDISKADAIAFFEEKGDEYKLELLEGLDDGDITFYTQGNFTDLCKGPHIPGTGTIKAIKLLSIAGAYWRGDESRKQLTRIYGVSFPKNDQLQAHLEILAEAKKRDHRKLGAELELFMFSEKVGAGLPIWMPKGTALRERLSNFMKDEQVRRGYHPVITPHIGKKDLYVTSGHYEKYGEDSFQPINTPKDGEEFLLKPMNCPHHCEIFAHLPKSYRDLPYRVAEFGTVYRYEQSGELHGLTRVRSFTQDDAHIFCTTEQLKAEFLDVLDLTTKVLDKLGFTEYTAQISLRDPETPDKYIGSDENWDNAERAIIEATEEVGLKTVTELGEAAFYGPKLDFMIKDALGRSWQLGTIQVDYNLPERFELEYVGADNEKHRPVMIHRAPFGSLERFIGVLIEHTGGKFPMWLAPDQVAILPISDKYLDYAHSVKKELAKKNVRTFIDDRVETIGRKIRDTELKKVPYMLIVGEKEQAANEVAVRKQAVGDLGSQSIGTFIESIEKEIEFA